MKNKGYTLIELLGVMIVLALLIGVTIPTIINFIKNTNEENDKQAVLLIENAAELYIKEYPNKFPKKNGSNYVIEIQDLLDSGNLPKSVKLSKFKILNENYVVAKYNNNKFSYKVKGKNDFYNITGTNNLVIDSNDYGILDYKIYGNSIQNGTPTQDSTIEVESVGNLINNVLDSYGFSAETFLTPLSNRSLTNDRGTIISTINYENELTITQTIFGNVDNLDSDSNGYFVMGLNNLEGNYILSFDIEIKNNPLNAKTITILNQGGVNGGNTQAINLPNGNSGRVSVKLNYLYNPNNNVRCLEFRCMGMSFTISNIMLTEEDSVVTSYGPNGKYEIPIIVNGKNLWNAGDKMISNTNTNEFTHSAAGTFSVDIKPTTAPKFSFSLDITRYKDDIVTNPRITFTIKYSDGGEYQKSYYYNDIPADGIKRNYTGIIENVENKEVIGFSGWILDYSSRTNRNIKAENIQLEIGDEATEYVPYVEPIITNIYLDEPLRKIGDAVDYIDFKEQKVVRKIGKIDLAGTWTYQSAQNRWYTSEFKNLYKVWDSTSIKINGISDSYPVLSYSEMNDGETMGLSVYGKNGNMFVRNGSRTEAPTGTLYFELRNPIEEKIELPNIESVEGANILEIDTKIEPSNVEITYYKD